jgi:uncharacterized alpha/beta hydrolase family protein
VSILDDMEKHLDEPSESKAVPDINAFVIQEGKFPEASPKVNEVVADVEKREEPTRLIIDLTNLSSPVVQMTGKWNGRLRQSAKVLVDKAYQVYLRERRAQDMMGGLDNADER